MIHAETLELAVGGVIECDEGGFSGGRASGTPHVGLHCQKSTTWLPSISTTIAGTESGHLNGTVGGAKGEGLRKLEPSYVNRYGRGAPANGGGGGSIQNSGGGGGSNVGYPLGVGYWDGTGVRNTTYESIWQSVEGINSSSPRPGGGKGGYSWNFILADFHLPAGCSTWRGDGRQDIGGRGGRPIPFYPDGSRIFFGGGGGAGDANDFVLEGGGGNGGGVIFVVADTIKGSGIFSANGGDGRDANIDGAGGGGAGGTVFIVTNNVAVGSSIDISVGGGKGGITYSTSPCVDCLTGPGGGGGGGGMIWIDPFRAKNSSMMSLFSEGGKEGLSNRIVAQAFPPSGATSGASTEVSHFITTALCSSNPIPCIIHNPSLVVSTTPMQNYSSGGTKSIITPPSISKSSSNSPTTRSTTPSVTKSSITPPISKSGSNTPTKSPTVPPDDTACSTDECKANKTSNLCR